MDSKAVLHRMHRACHVAGNGFLPGALVKNAHATKSEELLSGAPGRMPAVL